MEKFEGEFNKVKSDVYRDAKSHSKLLARCIILGVLILASIFVIVLGSKMWSFDRQSLKKDAKKNSAKNIELMDEYLENRDYMGLDVFAEEKVINSSVSEDYAPYTRVLRMAAEYRIICEWAMRYSFGQIYSLDDREIQRVIEYINYFYSYYASTTSIDSETEHTTHYCDRMLEDMESVLVGYYGLTIEEAKSLAQLSASRRGVVVEEALWRKIEADNAKEDKADTTEWGLENNEEE